MPNKVSTKFTFTLNFSQSEFTEKYGTFGIVPKNTTSLDLIKAETKSSYTFYDDIKNLQTCEISVIVPDVKKYCCFWDRHPIGTGTPIGCPIKYEPNRVRKTYKSEITKEKYSISQCVTHARLDSLGISNDKRFSVDERERYIIEGCFCSFNCLLAFLQDEAIRTDPHYRFSYALASDIYTHITGKNLEELIPAPHWKTLDVYGGTLSISDFRGSFGKIIYITHGPLLGASTGMLYSKQLRIN